MGSGGELAGLCSGRHRAIGDRKGVGDVRVTNARDGGGHIKECLFGHQCWRMPMPAGARGRFDTAILCSGRHTRHQHAVTMLCEGLTTHKNRAERNAARGTCIRLRPALGLGLAVACGRWHMTYRKKREVAATAMAHGSYRSCSTVFHGGRCVGASDSAR